MNRFGRAQSRPQDEDKNFLLYRRKINNGNYSSLWLSNPHEDIIRSWNFGNNKTDYTLSELGRPYTNKMFFVDSTESPELKKLLEAIALEREIAIDLEGNDDHSYLGT